ncbi:MAG: hypothetical protein U1F66_08780 [bacterium]
MAAFLLQASAASEEGGNAGPSVRAAQRLLENFRSNGEGGLRGALERLSEADRSALQRRFASVLPQMLNLATETDPELLYSELLSLGQRAQAEGDAGLGAAILQGLAEAPAWAGAGIPESVRRRARQEFDASRGVGSAGRRFEYLARHFVREATDPGMIVGMGVAGTVFSALRLGVLSRLALRPASWWTRGFAASALASSAAFPGEVLAFWGTTRAFGQLTRPEALRWDRATVGHELASLALTLGLLKLSGAAAEGIFDRVHGVNALTGEVARLPGFTRFSRTAFQQLGMFGGIAAGHYAETRLGLRPPQSGDTFWTDSLVTLLQFNVGGRLSHEILGPAHAARMQEVALRTHAVQGSAAPRGPWPFGLGGRELALVPEGLILPVPEGGEGPRSNAVFMSTLGPGKRGRGDGLERGTASAETARAGEPKPLSEAEPRRPSPNGPERPYKSLIIGLLSGDLSVPESYQVSQELYGDLPLARRVFTDLRNEGFQSEAPRDSLHSYSNLDQLLHRINRDHFETLSDKMQEWNARFYFLQSELRRGVNDGNRARRRTVRRLLDSVQLKMLETRRYHNDAESYLGDDKGASRKSVFAPENYQRLVQRFTDVSVRLDRYIQEKPALQRVLSRFSVDLPARRPGPVDRGELEGQFRRSPLSPERQDLLRQAVEEGDPLLTQSELIPLFRWFRNLNATSSGRRVKRAWRGLGEYLDALSALRESVPLRDLRLWETEHEFLLNPDNGAFESARRDLVQLISREGSVDSSQIAERYLAAGRLVSKEMASYRPQLRFSSTPEWAEMRAQLLRLGERQILERDTVQGLLEWFDPDGPRDVRGRHRAATGKELRERGASEANGGIKRDAAIHAIREEAVAGMIDFLRKGSHSREVQQELSGFVAEVVRRRDIRMMSVLAIYFQNYQLGMMRDRIQVRKQPAQDILSDQIALEAYDRFLEAMRNTARFYLPNRGVSGPYFEVFEKMEGGREDNNARLAAPVLHRTSEFLSEGYRVDLLSRGGLGEAVLFASHPDGRKQTVSVSSVLDPLEGRRSLEHWLDRAERELLHNGQYLTKDHGEHPLRISLQIFKIRSGVSKRDLASWARDYLEMHPSLHDIQLVIPKTGNEAADPLDASFFRVEQVARSMPTTEALIANRTLDLTTRPEDLSNRLELYQLRQDWLQYLHAREPDLRGTLSNFRWREVLQAKIAEFEGCLSRLREREQRALLPSEDSAAVEDLSSLLSSIATQEQRIQKGRALLQMGEEAFRLQSENWELLRESVRLFPADASLRSLAHRAAIARSQEMESRNRNFLTEEVPRRATDPTFPSVEQRRVVFFETAEMVLGRRVDPGRIPQLFNLGQVGFEIQNLRWAYGEKGLALQGDVALTEPIAAEPDAVSPRGPVINEVTGEPDSGFFSIRLSREPRSGALQVHFDTLTLPSHLRERNCGTVFFRELVRFAREMGAKNIVTEDVSGDHRYSLAVFGMRFKNDEARRRVVSPFQGWLEGYIFKLPEFQDFDTREIGLIQTPRDLARARLDPSTRSLRVESWNQGEDLTLPSQEVPASYQVGRLFLLNDSPSYSGVFELKDSSYSMRAFDQYLQRRLGRGYFSASDEN